jgi:heptose I phosphotransferase
MRIVISGEFARAWAGRDPFDQVLRLEGEEYRALEGRRTLRFKLDGRAYFAKVHQGIGWREIAKNLLRLRLPVLGAEREWRAIARLRGLGLDTMRAVAFGKRGWNPARRLSFLVTEALEPSIDLETFCADGGLFGLGVAERRRLIARIADIARTLHDNGLNHRDLYLCHLLLDTAPRWRPLPPADRPLYLIDLHRVQKRRRIPWRWRRKDLASLCYSARRAGFSRRDELYFLRRYQTTDLGTALAARPWHQVDRRARGLHRKGVRRGYHP